MGFLIKNTKSDLKIFRDNSVQPFFEIPKALVSKRMLESLAQAYDQEEANAETSERASESISEVTSERGESLPTDTPANETDPISEPETGITETKTSKKRKTR